MKVVNNVIIKFGIKIKLLKTKLIYLKLSCY